MVYGGMPEPYQVSQRDPEQYVRVYWTVGVTAAVVALACVVSCVVALTYYAADLHDVKAYGPATVNVNAAPHMVDAMHASVIASLLLLPLLATMLIWRAHSRKLFGRMAQPGTYAKAWRLWRYCLLASAVLTLLVQAGTRGNTTSVIVSTDQRSIAFLALRAVFGLAYGVLAVYIANLMARVLRGDAAAQPDVHDLANAPQPTVD